MVLKDYIETMDHTQRIMVVYDDDEKLYKIYEGDVASADEEVIKDRIIKDGSVFMNDSDEGNGHILVIRVTGGEAIQKDNAAVVEQGRSLIRSYSNDDKVVVKGPFPTILSDEEDDE